MMRVVLGLVAVLSGASALAAQDTGISREMTYTCGFVTECVDAEACAASDFSLNFTITAEGQDEADLTASGTLATDAQTIPLLGSVFGDTVSLFSFETTEFHVLTIGKGGTSRYTYHGFDGPVSITYLGYCEAK